MVCCGLATLDLAYVVARPPLVDEKVVARELRVDAGGPALNAARTVVALGGRATAEGFRIVGKVSDGLDGSLQNVVVFSRQAECGDDGGGSAVDVRIEGAQRFGKRLVGGQNGGSRELGGRFGLRYLHGESFD